MYVVMSIFTRVLRMTCTNFRLKWKLQCKLYTNEKMFIYTKSEYFKYLPFLITTIFCQDQKSDKYIRLWSLRKNLKKIKNLVFWIFSQGHKFIRAIKTF